ncbi:hypothetical protein SUGI_1127460 [Cryptomeria japonica]|uniref:putative UDP-rhamnose:rhamnosyltransferase 1 n=1 Tax=Cryptomeria japonica TaxID=3369 RepID=UPI002414887B|nr:putative UDP-rhamnose:rhamnosyltransferase 1 [Cryptomeria japonica]GLJ52927.1 hypothetical protein SUGI_1127460 [Cryptomeria japonica]
MADQRQLHVLMFPWLAHGHITPFLELAKSLQSHGLKISFLSTPLNIERIRHQISELQPSPEIDLVQLPMPAVAGLPTGVESTSDLSKIGALNLIPLLFKALDLCEKPFETLLKLLSPDFVIHDMVQYWAPRVAAKLGIPAINFVVLTAASMSFTAGHYRHRLQQILKAEDLTVPPLGFPSSAVRRRLFEARKTLFSYQNKQDGEGITFMDRRAIAVEESWAAACNTDLELEGKFAKYFEASTGRPVFPVGILMHDLPPRPVADPCLAWLDQQPARSVVFASFGSECALTRHQVTALVLGLEESEIPFLCILIGHDVAALPPEFEARTRGRGLVVTEWAPQVHILGHPSTGASLTHCGWTSITEGLRFGVPFVALPMQYDQGLNARLISEEFKVGEEVRRNEEDGSFTKEDIARAVRVVMVEEEGNKIKSNVEEISRFLTKDDCQVHRTNMHDFVSALKQKASKKQNI